MSEAPSPETPRRLLSDLCRLVADRASVEGQIEGQFAARNAAAEKESQEAQTRLDDRYRRDKTTAEEQYTSLRTSTATKFEADHGAIEQYYEKLRSEVLGRFTTDMQAAEQALQDAHWEAVENSDAARGGLNLPLKEMLAGLDSRWQELERIHQQAVELLQQRGHWDEFPEPSPPSVILEKQPGKRFCHALEQAQVQFATLSKQWLPQVFRGVRPLGFVFLLWLLAAYPSVIVFGWQDWRWAAISAKSAVIGFSSRKHLPSTSTVGLFSAARVPRPVRVSTPPRPNPPARMRSASVPCGESSTSISPASICC